MKIFSVFSVVVCVLSLMFPSVYAASPEDTILGGRLYDKWWVDTKLSKPESTHPAYPTEGKKKGADTWRCKECHGWDYRGKDGAYQKGSHYTGIKGIRDKAGANPDSIVSILKDDNHQYGDKLPDKALRALAFFVSQGQMEMSQFIDAASKKVKGDPAKGKQAYQDNCQSCHGKKGDVLNFSTKKDQVEVVGTLSNKNPWEIMHKIRFGHPGATMDMERMHKSKMTMRERHKMGPVMWKTMPPMFDYLTEAEQVDLLAYLQTLP